MWHQHSQLQSMTSFSTNENYSIPGAIKDRDQRVYLSRSCIKMPFETTMSSMFHFDLEMSINLFMGYLRLCFDNCEFTSLNQSYLTFRPFFQNSEFTSCNSFFFFCKLLSHNSEIFTWNCKFIPHNSDFFPSGLHGYISQFWLFSLIFFLGFVWSCWWCLEEKKNLFLISSVSIWILMVLIIIDFFFLLSYFYILNGT